MKCPFRGHLETQVMETRVTDEADFIRRRQCGTCEKRFASVYHSFEDIDEFKVLVDEVRR